MEDALQRWEDASEENARLVAEEAFILEATESLWHALEAHNISKAQLAERLNRTKGYVSQVLSGSRNMTLRTFADICFALKARPRIELDLEVRNWTAIENQPEVGLRSVGGRSPWVRDEAVLNNCGLGRMAA